MPVSLGITVHSEGINAIPIRIPTPRFQLEVGFSLTRVSDAFMVVDVPCRVCPIGRITLI